MDINKDNKIKDMEKNDFVRKDYIFENKKNYF